MKRLFRFILDINPLATLQLALKAKTFGLFQCRGKIQAKFEKNSLLNVTNRKKCFIGLRLKGLGSLDRAVTVIGAGQNSELTLGGSIIGRGAVINANSGAKISIGEGSYLNDGSQIYASQEIRIGKNCSISWNVTLIDDDGHSVGPGSTSQAIIIEDRVWIGCNVTILKGVTIGEGSIIAAGSVVTSSFPAKSLIGGVPAKLIRSDASWSNS